MFSVKLLKKHPSQPDTQYKLPTVTSDMMSLPNSISMKNLTSCWHPLCVYVCVCVLVYPTHLHWAADTLAVIPPTPWTEAQGPEWVRSNSGHEACSELFHAKRLTSCTGTAATHNAAHATVRWWCMQKERGRMNTWVWSTTSHGDGCFELFHKSG